MHQVKNTKKFKKKGEDVKVKYISSPLLVTTSASKFRALVQELTGRHSDISHLLENKYDNIKLDFVPATSAELEPQQESPASSESLFEPQENIFAKDRFLDLLHSDFLFDVSELDVLGSYDLM